MASTGEKKAVTPISSRDDTKEPLLTDGQPQIEQIFIKQEIELEVPEDHNGSDPLQEEQGEYVPERETSSPTDAFYIKQEPDCVLQEETTSPAGPTYTKPERGFEESSCVGEAESIIHTDMEDNRADDLSTGRVNTAQCTTSKEASCGHNSDTYLILSCNICKKAFTDFQDLKEHNHKDVPKSPRSCGICNKTYSTADNLKKHLHEHCFEDLYSCQFCQNTLTTPMKKHTRQHKCKRPYTCEVCHKVFITLQEMRNHLREHFAKHRVSENLQNQ